MSLSFRMRPACLIVAFIIPLIPPLLPAQEAVRSVEPREAEGISTAVVVPDVPLLHTTQLLPIDERGRLLGKGIVRDQIEVVLDRVKTAVRPLATDPAPAIVKLNVVA